MSTISKLFVDYLKDYVSSELSNQINTYGLDTDLHITTDNNFSHQFQKFENKDLFVVLISGNATRTTTDVKFYTQAMQLVFYVPINEKAKWVRILESYVKNQIDGTVEGLGTAVGSSYPYYANFVWNTPYVDNIVRDINGCKMVNIIMIANVTWCESDFSTNIIPTFKIGATSVVANVYNYKNHKESILDKYTLLGQSYQKPYENAMSESHTFSFIYDKNNTVHNTIKDSSSNYYSSITIGTSTFSGFLVVDYEANIGNFTSITVTIVR